MESNSNNSSNDDNREDSSSNTNSTNQLHISFLDIENNFASAQPRRRIIPRRHRVINLLSPSQIYPPSISQNITSQTNNNSNTNQPIQNDYNPTTENSGTLSPTVPNLEPDSDRITELIHDLESDLVVPEMTTEHFFDYPTTRSTRYPFFFESERMEDVPSGPLSSRRLPLFLRSFNNPLHDSDSDDDSPLQDLEPLSFSTQFEPSLFHTLPPSMRIREEEVDQTRLQQFQHQFNSMITYDEEDDDQEQQQTTASSTSLNNNTDSSDEDDIELLNMDNPRAMSRAAIFSRIRRRIAGESTRASHQRRFEKLVEDRFSYFLPVIRDWDRKPNLLTSYLRYHFIPPRK